MKNFEQRLKGGHLNSLGNTIEIVEEVLAENELFNELFNCYFSDDELVRLRTSNAMIGLYLTKQWTHLQNGHKKMKN